MRQGGIKMKLPKHDPDITFQIRLQSFKEGEIEIIETYIENHKNFQLFSTKGPEKFSSLSEL